VGFFKRLFSADYRAAVSAEAAGDLELAAERYALAGYHDAAARMHMARADRADSHGDKITALRDALHWASDDGDLRKPAARALGGALAAPGRGGHRTRPRAGREARLLERPVRAAGDAFESIGDDAEAARACAGRLVAGGRTWPATARGPSQARLREAFADYQLHLRAGRRRRPHRAAPLRRAVERRRSTACSTSWSRG
jgi:hypothetical protein